MILQPYESCDVAQMWVRGEGKDIEDCVLFTLVLKATLVEASSSSWKP